MLYNELVHSSVLITLGVLVCCFAKSSMEYATRMFVTGISKWAPILAFLSLGWGIFIIVHTLLKLFFPT